MQLSGEVHACLNEADLLLILESCYQLCLQVSIREHVLDCVVELDELCLLR